VRRLCDEELGGDADLEIIDVQQHPAAAGRDQIVAVPTLVRRLPDPLRRIVGDIWDPAWLRLRLRLDLGPPAAGHGAAGPDR
jgi:circadian clock protein KaiB